MLNEIRYLLIKAQKFNWQTDFLKHAVTMQQRLYWNINLINLLQAEFLDLKGFW